MHRPTLVLLLSAMFAAASGPLFADTATEQDYFTQLPEVLTVTRLAQPLSETPGAVTIIDRETIRRSGAREIAELLRLVPGFITYHQDSGARPTATYHADYDAIARHLQVMVDGRSTYSSLLLGTASHGLIGVILEDIERIEVLRGSNSASLGANAFLGVVNIVTRHAADTRGGSVTAHYGEGGVKDASASIGWGTEEAAFRLSVASRGDSGYQNINDDKKVTQAHLRADFRLSASDDIRLTAGHIDYSWGMDNPARTEQWGNIYLNTQWSRQLSAGSSLSLGFSADEERYDDYYPNLRADGTSRRIQTELQHVFSLGSTWRFAWGGQYRHEQVISPDLFYNHPDQRLHVWRLFGHAEWKPHRQWTVNFGGLLEDHSIVGESRAPRAMVNFHLLPTHTLRYGTTEAFKQPSLFELRADWRSGLIPLVRASGNVRATRIEATEIGYYGEFRELGLTADIRGFHEHVTGLMRFWGNPRDVVNKDNNVQKGWETQLRWRPRAGTEIWLNHASLRLVPDAGSTTPQDRQRAPHNISSLAWFQQLPAGFEFALIHYMLSPRFFISMSNMAPEYSQTDLRLARRFLIGTTRVEAALAVRAASGEGLDYVNSNARFEVDRRAHATLRIEF